MIVVRSGLSGLFLVAARPRKLTKESCACCVDRRVFAADTQSEAYYLVGTLESRSSTSAASKIPPFPIGLCGLRRRLRPTPPRIYPSQPQNPCCIPGNLRNWVRGAGMVVRSRRERTHEWRMSISCGLSYVYAYTHNLRTHSPFLPPLASSLSLTLSLFLSPPHLPFTGDNSSLALLLLSFSAVYLTGNLSLRPHQTPLL